MKKLLNKAKEISYSKFRKLGYTGNFNDFSYEINKLILMSKELGAPSLDIAGGKSCQRSKFLSGGLGVLTALSAGGFDTATANKLPDNISSHTRKRGILNKVDRDTSIALSIFALGGVIIGSFATKVVVNKFKDDDAVLLFDEDFKKFNTIDYLCSEGISIEKLTDEIKKEVFLEFVKKFIEYSKVILQNISIDELFTDCTTCELTIDNIETNYNYINKKLRQFTKKDINKNAFWGCYNLYVSAYQNKLKEIELTTVQKKLDREQEEKNELQNNYKEMEKQKNEKIEKVQNELEQTTEENTGLQNTVTELNQQKQELQQMNEEIKKQNKKEIDTVQTELEQKQKDCDELQKKVHELNQKQKELIEMNEELKKQNQTEIEKVQDHSEHIKNKEIKYNLVIQKYAQLNEENENLRIQNEQLETANQKLKSNIEILENYKITTKNRIQELKKDLQKIEEDPSVARYLFRADLRNSRIKRKLIVLVQNYITMLQTEQKLLGQCKSAIPEASADPRDRVDTFTENLNDIEDVLDMLERLQLIYTKSLCSYRVTYKHKHLADDKKDYRCDSGQWLLMAQLQQFHRLLDDLFDLLLSGVRNVWNTNADSPTNFVDIAENMFEKIIAIINNDCEEYNGPRDILLSKETKIFLLRVVRRTIQKAIPTSIQEKIFNILNPAVDSQQVETSKIKTLKPELAAGFVNEFLFENCSPSIVGECPF